MTGKRRWMAPVFLAVFLAALVLLWSNRDAIREMLLVPLLYVLWLGRLIFNSIDQVLFWVLLLALVVLVLGRGLSSRPRSRQDGSPAGEPDRGRNRRVRHWATQLRRIDNGLARDSQSLGELRRLIRAVASYRMHVSPGEVEQGLERGSLELPPGCQAYFEDDNHAEAAPAPAPKPAVRRVLHRLASLWRGQSARTDPLREQRLEALLECLEAQMEQGEDDRT